MTEARRTVLVWAVSIEGGLVALAWLLGWWLDLPPLRTFAWDGGDALKGLAATVPLLVLLVVMFRWPVGPFAGLKRLSEEVLRPALAPCTVVDLVGISILAGIGEEMVFRGVAQAGLERSLGLWGGLVAASVLFGLVHFLSVTYFVLATLMGAYLGALWMYSGNLLVPVVVHGAYDLVALLWLLRGPGSTGARMDDTANANEPGT
jgi:membrane protease YdiL (CAAX protease family)